MSKSGGPISSSLTRGSMRQETRSARRAESQKRSREVNVQVEKDRKMLLERQDKYDAALCHLTPLAPEPGVATRRVFKTVDMLRISVEAVFGATFGALELDSVWNQTFDWWRIWMGLVPLVYGVALLMQISGMVMSYFNERFLAMQFSKANPDLDMNNTESEAYKNAVIKLRKRVGAVYPDESGEASRALEAGKVEQDLQLPFLNSPTPRTGVTYMAIMTTLFCVIWAYLYTFLGQGNGIHPQVFNDERGFRVYMWMFTLLSFLDLVVVFVDYKELVHVGMQDSHEAYRGVLGDAVPGMHSDLAEQSQAYPDLSLLLTWGQLVTSMTVPAVVVLSTLAITQLALGPDSLWDISNWRRVAGIESIVAGALTLLHLVARYLAREHEAAAAAIMDGFWYWTVFFFGFGTNWYYMFKFSNDGRTPVTPGTLNQQSYEGYVWITLFFNILHFFYTYFHHLRCFVSAVMQRVYCPNLYGF